jgi:hypothetical protein
VKKVLQPKTEGVGICRSVIAHHVIEACAETAPAFVVAVFQTAIDSCRDTDGALKCAATNATGKKQEGARTHGYELHEGTDGKAGKESEIGEVRS